MSIPARYYVEDGEAPEGTVLKECCVCKCKFAVPEDEAEGIPDVGEVCEACAAATVSDPEGNSEASETIEKALGK